MNDDYNQTNQDSYPPPPPPPPPNPYQQPPYQQDYSQVPPPIPPGQPQYPPQYPPQYTQQYPPPPYPQSPYQPYPNQNVTYVPVYVKPKIPGRGFGISSMVLGIIGIFYSLIVLLVSFITTSAANLAMYYTGPHSAPASVVAIPIIILASVYSVFAILSCIFSLVAFKRGYKNGVSMSGFIMSLASFACLVASVVVAVVNTM